MKEAPAALIFAGLLAGVAPQSAVACSPAAQTPSQRPQTGPGCDWSFQIDAYEGVALSGLTDLGGGLIAQRLREGNACYFEASLLVTDCKTGEARLYGPDRVALMEGPKSLPVQRLWERLDRRPSGALSGLRAVSAEAESAGVKKSVPVPQGSELRFGGKVRMPLSCGCQSLYPGAKK